MNNIELTVIGCGDAFNSGGRHHTSFYVKSSSIGLLIDCGTGVCAGLKHNAISSNDVDLIVISHFHGDHYGGLPFFLLEAAVLKRSKPLTIISPPGCREKVEQLLKLLYPGSSVLNKLTIHFENYEDNITQTISDITISDININAIPVIHNKATLPHGLRINIGSKVISYSGDTEWTSALEVLAKDADLFICECNFYALSINGHMNYKVLSENLHRLHFKRIMLTHFDNEMLRNQEKVKLECLVDNMKILV